MIFLNAQNPVIWGGEFPSARGADNTQLLDYWEKTGKVEAGKIKATREFLER